MSRRRTDPQLYREMRVRLVEWLNRPVLPPSGAQLDPFAGHTHKGAER